MWTFPFKRDKMIKAVLAAGVVPNHLPGAVPGGWCSFYYISFFCVYKDFWAKEV